MIQQPTPTLIDAVKELYPDFFAAITNAFDDIWPILNEAYDHQKTITLENIKGKFPSQSSWNNRFYDFSACVAVAQAQGYYGECLNSHFVRHKTPEWLYSVLERNDLLIHLQVRRATPKGKITPWECQLLKEEYERTKSSAKAAQLIGCTEATVRRIRNNGWRPFSGTIKQSKKDHHTDVPGSTQVDTPETPEDWPTNAIRELSMEDTQPSDDELKEMADEGIIMKMIGVRNVLINYLLYDGGTQLRIEARTLSELVKAMLDIDKRIMERLGSKPFHPSYDGLRAYADLLSDISEQPPVAAL